MVHSGHIGSWAQESKEFVRYAEIAPEARRRQRPSCIRPWTPACAGSSTASQLAAEALVQAGELKHLINDLVDLARYGQPPFHTEDVRLDLVAERVTARAGRRVPEVSFEVSGTPTLVHGDPDALERAVANLVDNAVKWSPCGGRVQVRVSGGTLEVADGGPGIPEADRPYVFDRFYRSPAARADPGSGLGLAIVRQVAEAHGGTAEALPSASGARLRLTLRVCGDPAPDPQLATGTPARGAPPRR